MKKIAKIVFNLPIDGPFDYLISRSIASRIKVGSRVVAPFRNLKKVGYVVGLANTSKIKKIRPVISLIDNEPVLNKGTLGLLKSGADYYNCSWGQMIEAALPTSIRKGKRITINYKQRRTKANKARFQATLIYDSGADKRWDFIYKEINKVVSLNRTVIFLEPQVVYIDRTVSWLQEKFGKDVAVLHSRQPAKNELSQWVGAKEGKVNIVVGTRSAIFAPIDNLGLIIINEEDNQSYKQEQSPFYHTRNIALLRAKQQKVHLILISQLPSLESYYSSVKKECNFIDLKDQLHRPSQIEIVDMNQEALRFKRGKAILSPQLENNINKTLEADGKVILFINRLGFATSLRCRNCGHSLKCNRCNAGLTYHYDKKKLICRFCNYKTEPLDICPECKNAYIRYSGVGTEKLESEIHRMFPQAKIARWDSEVGMNKDNFDILISTKILLKGHVDCSLLGVLGLDRTLNRVDFRSSEEAFSLLFRLSKLVKNKMIIQTRNPQHDCFQAIAKYDPFLFFKRELKQRREAGFPPFKHFVQVQLRGKSQEGTKDAAFSLYERLKSVKKSSAKVLEPFSGFPSKLRGNYRWNILLKGNSIKAINTCINRQLKGSKRSSGVIIHTNVDI